MSIEAEFCPSGCDHVVQFYMSDDDLVDAVSSHLFDGLRVGELIVVMATADHMAGFGVALSRLGLDVESARREGRLVDLDADQVMGRLMSSGEVDSAVFDEVVGSVVRIAATSGRAVRVYGELVALLWESGCVAAAMEVESMWNVLGAEVRFSLLCGYPANAVERDEHVDALHELCHLHSTVVARRDDGVDHESSLGATVRRFDDDPRAPRAARRFVVETLEGWKLWELCDDAALVVSELATNAVLHARSDFSVVVSWQGTAVRVSVRDASAAAPVRQDVPVLATAGRGVALVAAIAGRWGAELVGGGKIVWAELSP